MRFLSQAEVLRLHRIVIERYGGSHGVRDVGLLQSALAQPAASFGGVDLHPTVLAKAAAYGFHLVKNHPFSDGNKRIAALTMGVFLDLHGWDLGVSNDELYGTIAALAEGRMSKLALTDWLEEHARQR